MCTVLLPPGGYPIAVNNNNNNNNNNNIIIIYQVAAGVAQSVQLLATGWTVRGINPIAGKRFSLRRNLPDRPWSPPSLLPL
jgi:hypothetical protein